MLKYYKPFDATIFRFRDVKEVHNLISRVPTYFEDLNVAADGNAFTIWADEWTPVAIGGWSVSIYDTATIFMMASVDLDKKFNKEIMRDIKTVVNAPKKLYKRTDALVAGNDKNKRFIEFLGLKQEAILQKYDFDGGNMYLYSYIRDE
jgi:hypothetical protein